MVIVSPCWRLTPASGHWAAAIIGCAVVIAALMAAGRFTGAGLRAALWGPGAAWP